MISGTQLFIGLFNNTAVFLVLAVAYGHLNRMPAGKSSLLRQSVTGIGFGIFAIACMHFKIPVANSTTIDLHHAMVVLSGVFGGPASALLSAVTAGTYRFQFGGNGIFGAGPGLFLAAIAGSILHKIKPSPGTPLTFGIGSLLAALCMLPVFFAPGNTHEGWIFFQQAALPYSVAMFIGLFFGSSLLAREEHRHTLLNKLMQSERRYRDMFESLIDVAYRTDLGGVIQIITPSVGQLLGYTPAEVVGKPLTSFYKNPLLHPYLSDEIKSNGHIENFENDIRKKDGTFIRVSTNARLLRNELGEACGIEGITRDISNLKKAEEEKLVLEESLRQNQKMESIGTLAGGIAHDFNNILAAIIGYAEMALQKLDATNPVSHDVQGILRSGLRAKELVRHILIFSRKSSYDPVSVEVSLALKEALRMIRASIPSTIDIKDVLRYRNGTIFADPTEIHQVIMNLCANAAQAMENTGGVITVLLDRATLSVEDARKEPVLQPGPYIVIKISDTGPGIEKEHLERIFDPFFTTKEIGQGTGLGLAVVHGIVNRLGGKICVESTPGRGAAFSVYFKEAGTVQRTTLPGEYAPEKGSERILLVDDELLIVEVTRRRLELLGYQVTSFTRSEEALECFLRQPDNFDCVITDQTMPKMNGEQLTRALLDARPDIPIILCTGFSASIDAEKAQKIGIKAFVLKPLDQKNLATAVRTVLDGAAVPEVV